MTASIKLREVFKILGLGEDKWHVLYTKINYTFMKDHILTHVRIHNAKKCIRLFIKTEHNT